jgi:hypothetical protein
MTALNLPPMVVRYLVSTDGGGKYAELEVAQVGAAERQVRSSLTIASSTR